MRAWLFGAAIVIGLAAAALWRFRPQTPMSRLLAAVPRDVRLVEPRLSGGFPWAPFSAAERTADAGWQFASALSGATRGLMPEARTVATAGLLLGKPGPTIGILSRTPEGSRDA